MKPTVENVYSCQLQYCKHGAFGTIVTKDAGDYYTKTEANGKYQPKGDYLTATDIVSPPHLVTKESVVDSAAMLSWTQSTKIAEVGGKNITVALPPIPSTYARNNASITPTVSASYDLGSKTAHWRYIFSRRLYVTSGSSDSLTAAGLGSVVGLGWIELRSSSEPYIDFAGSNSTADYSARLRYANNQLEVHGAPLSANSTLRCKGYVSILFDHIGSGVKADSYGVMVYKRDKYFNFVKTKKGAPDTISDSHGGSLMEINLATNAVSVSGTFTQGSDERLKDVTGNVRLTLEDIANAPAILYRWKAEGAAGELHAGSIAQYWQTRLPQVVSRRSDGYLGLDYGVLGDIKSTLVARCLVTVKNDLLTVKDDMLTVKDEMTLLRERVAELEKEVAELRSAA